MLRHLPVQERLSDYVLLWLAFVLTPEHGLLWREEDCASRHALYWRTPAKRFKLCMCQVTENIGFMR